MPFRERTIESWDCCGGPAQDSFPPAPYHLPLLATPFPGTPDGFCGMTLWPGMFWIEMASLLSALIPLGSIPTWGPHCPLLQPLTFEPDFPAVLPATTPQTWGLPWAPASSLLPSALPLPVHIKPGSPPYTISSLSGSIKGHRVCTSRQYCLQGTQRWHSCWVTLKYSEHSQAL